MTYVKGSVISAADINSFTGITGAAAPDSATATGKIGYLSGIGYGDRGYGALSPAVIPNITAGQSIGFEWFAMRIVLGQLYNWQGNISGLIPPFSAFASKAAIIAHERDAPSLNAYDLPDLISMLDTNRFDYKIENMTLDANLSTSTRASTWGAGNSGITAEFSVTFASENAARYFFNTGGDIRLSLNHPSTASSRDSSWNAVLNNLTVAFKAHDSVRLSGTSGTASSIGYYELTTAYQTILDGTNSGTGMYTSNDFTISAKAQTITGLNGAKGNVIYFKVQLIDEQTNAFSDIVQGGTNSSISLLRAAGSYSVIAPTVSVVTAF